MFFTRFLDPPLLRGGCVYAIERDRIGQLAGSVSA